MPSDMRDIKDVIDLIYTDTGKEWGSGKSVVQVSDLNEK
jgi:hypothetical protein